MPDSAELPRLGCGAAAPALQSEERRASWGMHGDPGTPDHYMVELNLMHRGGLEAADAEFHHLYALVVSAPDSAGRPRSPIPVSRGYYTCLISVREWSELIRRDERPSDEVKPRGIRDRAIYRIWPDFKVRPQAGFW
jgi:hypothetical protein